MILWAAITVCPHLNYKAKELYEALYCKLTSLTKQAAKQGIQGDTQLDQTDEDSAHGKGSFKATITQVYNWDLIEKAILHAPAGACVVFDIDGVILEEVTHRNLVDPKILEVIESIKDKNLKAYALTHGGWGTHRRHEKRRFARIQQLGIDFSELSQFQDSIEIPYQAYTALMYHGIIFARDRIDVTLPKGPIFFEVLERLNEQPKHIIFIDDREYNLRSMEKECRKRRIPFQGFLYLGDKY